MTRVVFYAKHKTGSGKRLRGVINVLVPQDRVEVCRSVEGLCRKLSFPRTNNHRTLAVLVSETQQDLQELLEVRELLEDASVIMVLPDEKQETLAMAHRMRPRFITYTGGTFADVAGVAAKLLQ